MALFFFFFNDTATTEIYTLSLHDALPILAIGKLGEEPLEHPRGRRESVQQEKRWRVFRPGLPSSSRMLDRKSTRLNSSHQIISYAVFCLKKKKHSMPVVEIQDVTGDRLDY